MLVFYLAGGACSGQKAQAAASIEPGLSALNRLVKAQFRPTSRACQGDECLKGVRLAGLSCARRRGWRVVTLDAETWKSMKSEEQKISMLQQALR